VLRAAGDVERACALHSLDLLYQLRDDVLDQHHTVVENQTSWVVRCSQAVGECEELATLYPGDGWEPPTSLRNWTTLGGAAISRPADR